MRGGEGGRGDGALRNLQPGHRKTTSTITSPLHHHYIVTKADWVEAEPNTFIIFQMEHQS